MQEIKCEKHKELIMEMVDGEIKAGDISIVESHLKSCKECADYKKDLINMTVFTNSMKVEAPDFMETRIMARIAAPTAVSGFRWFPALSYGSTFAVAVIAGFLLIYNKPGTVEVNTASVKKAEKTTVASVKKVTTETSKTTVKSVEIAKKEAPAVIDPPKNEEKKEVIASAPYMAPVNSSNSGMSQQVVPSGGNKSNGVSQVENSGMVSAASGLDKVPVPTRIPLLESEKAIVANNLINPDRGETSRIMINVEDACRVRIMIYDKNMQVVKEIVDEDKLPGKYEALWAGKNDENRTVSQGVYFVYIQLGKRVIKKNIMVVKQ